VKNDFSHEIKLTPVIIKFLFLFGVYTIKSTKKKERDNKKQENINFLAQ
jgi:hypothetical protein